jgi:hypothetical protein
MPLSTIGCGQHSGSFVRCTSLEQASRGGNRAGLRIPARHRIAGRMRGRCHVEALEVFAGAALRATANIAPWHHARADGWARGCEIAAAR